MKERRSAQRSLSTEACGVIALASFIALAPVVVWSAAPPAGSALPPRDVFFVVDVSGDMTTAVANLKQGVSWAMSALLAENPDTRFGVAAFCDYPIAPFGDSGDSAYARYSDLVDSTSVVLVAFSSLTLRGGGDLPESQLAALYQAATGAGQVIPDAPLAGIAPGQQATFRANAEKVMVLITSSAFHQAEDPGTTMPYPGPTRVQALAGLDAVPALKVVGIAVGGGGELDLRDVSSATTSLATTALDCDGDGEADIPPGGALVCSVAAELVSSTAVLLVQEARNHPPEAGALEVTTVEDSPIPVSVQAVDDDGDTIEYAVATPPAHGSLSGTAPDLTYTPAADYHGQDSFTFTVSDAVAEGNTATVTITVTPVNDAPLTANDTYRAIAGTTLVVAAPGVLGNDADLDGDPLQAMLTSAPSHGALTLNPEGSFSYVPASGFTGVDSFSYTATDGMAESAGATVVIAILPVLRTRSDGLRDGWVLESTETSGRGGTLEARRTTLRVGDDGSNRQYRSILSFDTAALPGNAVVESAKLKLRYQGTVGTNPFKTHGNIVVDAKRGGFSNSLVLQVGDFQALATRNAAATILNRPVSGWYTTSVPVAYVKKGGYSQFRVRLAKDDNNDRGADYLSFYSGNAAVASRPVLELVYSTP